MTKKKLWIAVTTIVMLAAIMLPTLAQLQGRPMTFEQANNVTLSDGFKALKGGDSQIAFDLFQRVAAASPSSEAGGTANFTLGNVSRKSGDLEYAQEYYRRGFNSKARVAASQVLDRSGPRKTGLMFRKGRL